MSGSQPRLLFIDNIRILLITLVLLLHIGITYGAPGDWYYREIEFNELSLPLAIPAALFTITIQAFTLGCFFMISAYFTAAAYERKGAGLFIKGRLKRLGIPLMAYIAVLHPLTICLLLAWPREQSPVIPGFLSAYYFNGASVSTGPLWFVATLLFFSVCYLIWRAVTPTPAAPQTGAAPGNAAMAMFALIMGVAAFAVRIRLPVGWSLQLLNFQFPHFPQYIGMFLAGIAAHRNGWFEGFEHRRGIRWLIASVVLILTIPVLLCLGGILEDQQVMLGGMHWQSLVYAVWEQFVCVGMAAGLTVLFRSRLNHQGPLLKELSRNAYAVYIIHAPVLVATAIIVRHLTFAPLLKFLIMAPVMVSVSFILAGLLRRLPLARDIV